MQINLTPIGKIKPYERNAKLHPKKQVDLVANSIKRFGWAQPIVIDSKNEIIIGHCRLLAAKQLNLSEVPTVLMENLTEDEIKALRLADNKSNESGWDMALAIDELSGLNDELFNLTGFDKDLITKVKEDDVPEVPETPKTVLGDLFELGDHRLLCGDSEKDEDYKKLFKDDKANLIFTDPPYSVDYRSVAGYTYNSKKFGGTGGKIFNDNKNEEEALEFYKNVLKNLYQYSIDNASIYWWYATKQIIANRNAFKDNDWHVSQVIIWLKPTPILSLGQLFHRCYEPCLVGWKEKSKHYFNKNFSGFKDVWVLDYNTFQEQLDVWYNKRDLTSQYLHPTQKPVKLAVRALTRSSEIGDIVADVFGGSGSTMIACEQMQRKCRMMELDPKYCDVIVQRYVDWTGNENITKNGEQIVWKKTQKQL